MKVIKTFFISSLNVKFIDQNRGAITAYLTGEANITVKAKSQRYMWISILPGYTLFIISKDMWTGLIISIQSILLPYQDTSMT